MLYNGEEVGDGTGPECDVAVDPIDGTTLTAKGMTNAISVMAVAPARRRCTTRPRCSTWRSWSPAPRPPTSSTSATRSPRTSTRSPRPRARSAEDVTVVLLDRPRHEELVDEIRATGARIKFITDGDVAGAIMAARADTGIDLLLGIGGTPEGIIAACAMKCLGGVIQGRLWPHRRRGAAARARRRPRPRPRHVLTTDDLVTGDDCFFVATGITDGELMQGVRYRAGGAHHPLAGDALAQRHDPHHHLRAPARRSYALTPSIDFEH